ncbi:hypothetical protein GCM10020220_000600 [Nonomuraea rubra]|uniref:hypothetical protein n=1 Tax=Nonomuraea rubra TaxID=46180 RepID=UPI0031EB7657
MADHIVGLLITVAIGFVLRDAAREIYHRLMDAVDPALVDDAERITGHGGRGAAGGVRTAAVDRPHALHAEVEILVDHDMSVVAAHKVAVEADEHRLIMTCPGCARPPSTRTRTAPTAPTTTPASPPTAAPEDLG